MKFALAAGIAAAALSAPVHAGVHAGIGAVDEIEGKGSVLGTLSYVTEQRHPFEFMLGYIGERDATAVRTPGTAWVSVSKRFTWGGWFGQGGIAWADADNEVLSRHWQFHTGAGYDFGRFVLSLRHLSNADTGGRNRGETFLLIEYGF